MIKAFNVIKKLYLYFYTHTVFLLFWLTLISFFLNYVKPYVNTEWCARCAIAVMTIIMNNIKCFLKRHFWGDFNKLFLKINLLLWKKPYCIQQLRCTAKLDKFYEIYLVLTKEMAQKWHLWQELLKSSSKIWIPSYDWMAWCRQQGEDINYIVMEDLNLWSILAKVLLELIT